VLLDLIEALLLQLGARPEARAEAAAAIHRVLAIVQARAARGGDAAASRGRPDRTGSLHV
jgi:hypothetical protein